MTEGLLKDCTESEFISETQHNSHFYRNLTVKAVVSTSQQPAQETRANRIAAH